MPRECAIPGSSCGLAATASLGVAVLDDDVKLPEGTPVVIQPAPAGSLQDVLNQVSGKVKNLPADGSLQHDHYIYGTPKR